MTSPGSYGSSWYFNRTLVYSVLGLLGGMMLLDAVPPYTLLNSRCRDGVDPVLDFTGLWQGNWQLFAPSPDHVNVRVGATMTWDDGTFTVWRQPDWHAMNPMGRIRSFRQMSYFDNLVRPGNESAHKAFCEYLARRPIPIRS